MAKRTPKGIFRTRPDSQGQVHYRDRKTGQFKSKTAWKISKSWRKRKKIIPPPPPIPTELEFQLKDIMSVEYGTVIQNYIERFIRARLRECERPEGYFYKITIKQINKNTAEKEMRLYNRAVRRILRPADSGYYTLERVFWITVNAIQRMKNFWGLHSGKAVLRIDKIR